MIKKTFILITLFTFPLFLFSANETIDLTNKNEQIIIIDSTENKIPQKLEKDYMKKEDLLVPVEKEIQASKKEKDGIKVNGGVDFDTESKDIDGAKINIGTKF